MLHPHETAQIIRTLTEPNKEEYRTGACCYGDHEGHGMRKAYMDLLQKIRDFESKDRDRCGLMTQEGCARGLRIHDGVSD